MRIQRLLRLALLPALLGACQDNGEPNVTDAASTGAATEATTDPTGGAEDTTDADTTTASACVVSECEALCAESHDAPCDTPYAGSCEDDLCVCEKQPDDCVVFPPVACGMEMCVEGQICVQPGEDCDYNSDPPKFFTPPPTCGDVPSTCEDKTGQALADCLDAEYCPDDIGGLPTEYKDGKLTCSTQALDCF